MTQTGDHHGRQGTRHTEDGRQERTQQEDGQDAHPVALILGGAECLHDDIRLAEKLVDPTECVVIAVNDAGFEWPHRLDHWVTMHPEELPARRQLRQDQGFPGDYVTWTRPYPAGMKERESICDRLIAGWNGSSGLLAVGVAVQELGLPAILCGMPLDDRPHFNRKGRWEHAYRYRVGWQKNMPRIKGRVRSFSGWTAEVLGKPSRAWLVDVTGVTPVA